MVNTVGGALGTGIAAILEAVSELRRTTLSHRRGPTRRKAPCQARSQGSFIHPGMQSGNRHAKHCTCEFCTCKTSRHVSGSGSLLGMSRDGSVASEARERQLECAFYNGRGEVSAPTSDSFSKRIPSAPLTA